MGKGSLQSLPLDGGELRPRLVKPDHKLSRKQLINRLNAVNFKDGMILVNLRHNRFENNLTLTARPDPCTDEQLVCRWLKPDAVPSRLSDYSCSNFLLNDGMHSYAVTPETISIDRKGICFSLPAVSRRTATRQFRRYPSHGISAQFFQNSCRFNGELADFSTRAMRITLTLEEGQSAHWLNPAENAELILSNPDGLIFSGNCRIIRVEQRGSRQLTLAVELNRKTINRYRNSEFRSSRQQLVPSPTVAFRHPLSGRLVNLLTRAISGTGFAVDEAAADALLVPGMIIPELQLRFTSSFSISCRTQVVYVGPLGDDEPEKVRVGMAFLDMPADHHLQLLSLVHRAENEKANLSHSVDTDQLLDFFFNAGFIYPEKYASVAVAKSALKETYERLYNDSPSIARHFLYQDNDRIYAHMAAVRFHQNAWMIHHHAASGEGSTRAGIDVLNQTTRWLNDSRYIPSVHLDYFYCYFRDTNRFPMRLFGGIYNGVGDIGVCSLDAFAYFHHHPEKNADWSLEKPWSLNRANEEDLQEFGFFYEASSGGLMINAFDLMPESPPEDSLNAIYAEHGFKRERHVFALKDNDKLKAMFIVNVADFGLNLSELTNAIQVYVPDHEELPRQILELILSLLCLKFRKPTVPVLMYPDVAAEHYGIAIEKKYLLWIFSAAHMDRFYQELKKLIRTISH